MWAECGRSLFFLTGHHNQFSRLQYACAFIGFDEFHFRAAGALLFVNTFGTEILAALAFPEVAAARMAAAQATAAASLLRELARLCLLHALLNSARMLLSAANVALQRDHLMLWAVFAPKFLFDT
ncbi:unnamed protein product, partial [Phaeothamnion confervicola]